jgi:hypothetical protein
MIIIALLLLRVRALWHGGRGLLLTLYGILLTLVSAPFIVGLIGSIPAIAAATSALTEVGNIRMFPVINFSCAILFHISAFLNFDLFLLISS